MTHNLMADKMTLTMLVPMKKWLESVGRNFKSSVCNGPVFAASRRDALRAGQTRRGGKNTRQTAGQRLTHSQPKTIGATVARNTSSYSHCTYTRMCSNQMSRWQKHQPTGITRSYDRDGAAVFPRGRKTLWGILSPVVGFDGWSSRAIYQSHLSAVRRRELWSNLTFPPGLSPAWENEGAKERERERESMCEKDENVVGKNRECSKTGLPYLDQLESRPRWLLGVAPPPKGHREEIIQVHQGMTLLFVCRVFRMALSTSF